MSQKLRLNMSSLQGSIKQSVYIEKLAIEWSCANGVNPSQATKERDFTQIAPRYDQRMSTKLRRNLLKAALASFTPSYLFAQKTNDAKFPIPLTVSWSKLDLMNGETISYADLKGQVLVIYFWASW